MAATSLLEEKGLEAYCQLERLLAEVWGDLETSGSVPPLNQRISLSITKVPRYGFVPCIHVDREDSPAYRRALEILDRFPFVKTTLGGGEAQSAYPQTVKLPPRAISGLIAPGSTVSHGRYPFGSVGCIVEIEIRRIKVKCVVTAAHVVALNDQVKRGDAIYCPGKGSVPRIKKSDVFGVLQDSVDLFPLNPRSRASSIDNVSSDIDVALVKIEDDDERRGSAETRVPDPDAPDTKEMKIKKDPLPEAELGNYVGQDIFLFGAVSGFRVGTLTDLSLQKKVLRLPDRLNYMYHDLLGVAPKSHESFSQPGDSGSIIYTKQGFLIGFLIGADTKVSLACVGERALGEFNAKVV